MKLIQNLKRWYKGSSFELYINKVEKFEAKGDFAGMWYMLFCAFTDWFIFTVTPVMVFVITLFYLTINISVLVSFGFVFVSVPQLLYFWNEKYKYYLEITKELRNKEAGKP